jgi:hypothetical protein
MQGIIMRVNASPFRISLQWGRPLTVADGKGTCITSRRGTVWITQDNDLRDVVLCGGESFVLDHPDLAIVQAFDTAEVMIMPPAPVAYPAVSQPPLARRFMKALRRSARLEPAAVQ